MKAHVYHARMGGRQAENRQKIPADLAEGRQTSHEGAGRTGGRRATIALMEEGIFEKGTLPMEDLMKGLPRCISSQAHSTPVVLTSALPQHRQRHAARFLADVFPDRPNGGVAVGHSEVGSKGNELHRKIRAPPSRVSVFVYYKHSGRFPSPGRISFSRLMSGECVEERLPRAAEFTRRPDGARLQARHR